MTGPETPDFTRKREPIQFTIDGYTYKAPPIMNPINLGKIVSRLQGVDMANTAAIMADLPGFVQMIADTARALMPGVHGETFATRLMSEGTDGEPQIDLLTEAVPAFNYLMEALGKGLPGRPLPSSNGSTGLGTAITSDATSSTAGVSPTE